MINLRHWLNQIYSPFSRSTKRWIFISIDACLFIISIYISFCLRFDELFPWVVLQRYQTAIGVLILTKLIVFYFMRVYRPVLRYAGLEFLSSILKAVAVSSGVVVLLLFFMQTRQLPRSILINDGFLTIVIVLSTRLFIRWVVYRISVISLDGGKRKPVVIYGAGSAGGQLAQSLSRDSTYEVVAFIDDSRQLQKQEVQGIAVYPPKRLSSLIKKHQVEHVLLAMPAASRSEKQKIIHEVSQFSIPVKTVPSVAEIVSDRVSINELRNVDIVDLLGREEVLPRPELLYQNIAEKVVLVTGAGGSIGAELTRQIAQQHPKALILLERSELALYQIEMELQEHFPELAFSSHLGSVTDPTFVKQLITAHGVHTIYHAAAYKHVPLIEGNVAQGIINNIYGTWVLAQAAMESQIETFVLISTDKAVRPTNVMGATKRTAELILQALSQLSSTTTRFVIVRFGNVLDSNGSVVPRFRQQIAEGQAVTVTHPEITRYFMSIPEAARLVIQAGALGAGGEVLLLEMGEPVKIYDLAIQMIELSGLTPEKDIPIHLTGLRPGEKLHEELLIAPNNTRKTDHPKIFAANESSLPWSELESQLSSLIQDAKTATPQQLIQSLQVIVKEYLPSSVQ